MHARTHARTHRERERKSITHPISGYSFEFFYFSEHSLRQPFASHQFFFIIDGEEGAVVLTKNFACIGYLSVVCIRSIYELYSDYVLKNPFYEVEMPIRVELFDQYLLQLVGSHS